MFFKKNITRTVASLKRLKIIYLLVDIKWYLRLKLANSSPRKVRVGFGPIYTSETTLGSRKFRIDPIVNAINTYSEKYRADVFFKKDRLDAFDIIVFVKNFDGQDYLYLNVLKTNGKKIIYDINDNPAGCDSDFFKDELFRNTLSGVITMSQLDSDFCSLNGLKHKFIECPTTNSRFIKEYRKKDQIKLIWQGFSANHDFMERLHPIIAAIAEETGLDVQLIYHTNLPSRTEGIVKYVKWKVQEWEEMLASADVGIVIKPLDDPFQQRKPSNKLITYMVAGLPTVCTPCEADKLVMTHGENGFFAYTDEEWHKYLKMLIQDHQLRKKIGQKARSTVLKRNHPKKIAMDYEAFFDELSRNEND